ncbi:MAG: hypothetical protein JKY37_30850 [Nannocystaceae bacterium]|nr:hypothetical protein [Nannocystaceae bacterium]
MAMLPLVCWVVLAGSGVATPTTPSPGASLTETETETETGPAPHDPPASAPDTDGPAPDSASSTKSELDPPADTDTDTRAARWRQRWSVGLPEGVKPRRFIVAVEGLIAQAPPLRPTITKLDPRATGRTVARGGIGLFGRYRPVPLIGIEVGVRSASLRYADGDDDGVVSEDHVLADAGVLLYLARGEIAQFAFDAGFGGAWGRIAYEPSDGKQGSHIYGSGLVRVGVDAEFLLKRIAFVLSLRTVGVLTDDKRAKARGPIFEGTSAQVQRLPVPRLQTWLVASAGIGYRF